MPRIKEKKQNYTTPGIAVVVALTALVMLLGWLIANTINPPSARKNSTTIGLESDRQYLVYRSYRVLSRGDTEMPNDDTVAFEFFRYPLDGSALRGESIFRVERERMDDGMGTPWMKQVSDDIMLFAARNTTATEASWVDVSGKKLLTTEEENEDVVWGGLPAPNGRKTAYYDWRADRIMVVVEDKMPREYNVGNGDALTPVAWGEKSIDLYLKVVTEGGLPTAGLWRLNTDTGLTTEIEAVRELKLYDFDINPAAELLVGTTFICTNHEDCGTGPSSIHMVDLATENNVELYSSDHLAFGNPRISPDAGRVAYTMSNGQADVWIADLSVAGHERRVISGKVLDWISDGQWLVVDRDNEIQLVKIKDGTIISVVRRSGQYPDPDFYGVDYIGIVSKN